MTRLCLTCGFPLELPDYPRNARYCKPCLAERDRSRKAEYARRPEVMERERERARRRTRDQKNRRRASPQKADDGFRPFVVPDYLRNCSSFHFSDDPPKLSVAQGLIS